MNRIVRRQRTATRRRRPARLPRSPLALVIALAMTALGYAALPAGSGHDADTPVRGETPVAPTAFHICQRPPHRDCVIDGDTFYLGSVAIRIADIDTPEIHPARCEAEADLGARATGRLFGLLNAGPFSLAPWTDGRDEDRYGRKLRIVIRDGRSVGATLVAEGLARSWTGDRRPWCGAG